MQLHSFFEHPTTRKAPLNPPSGQAKMDPTYIPQQADQSFPNSELQGGGTALSAANTTSRTQQEQGQTSTDMSTGLMDLPAEIRNAILADAYTVCDSNGDRKPITMRTLLLGHKPILTSMIVSKQFHAEAAPLFWGNNLFVIDSSSRTMRTPPPPKLIAWTRTASSRPAISQPTRINGVTRIPGIAILLPPQQYRHLIKRITLRVSPITRDAGIAEAGFLGRRWAVRRLSELGFRDLETVTFNFIYEEPNLICEKDYQDYVDASEIDSKEVKVEFLRTR
ncbi:Hypothetical predicted protein [Lecanosticta acicola]|uniref:Uncharacterized protein n=1 Tax=Lecanosticta acicola TaxID=111012 RepID=A0AAI8YYH6_9PEZI|nr:Hypothetical predicted protein [Lecanosticta acicola]